MKDKKRMTEEQARQLSYDLLVDNPNLDDLTRSINADFYYQKLKSNGYIISEEEMLEEEHIQMSLGWWDNFYHDIISENNVTTKEHFMRGIREYNYIKDSTRSPMEKALEELIEITLNYTSLKEVFHVEEIDGISEEFYIKHKEIIDRLEDDLSILIKVIKRKKEKE